MLFWLKIGKLQIYVTFASLTPLTELELRLRDL